MRKKWKKEEQIKEKEKEAIKGELWHKDSKRKNFLKLQITLYW